MSKTYQDGERVYIVYDQRAAAPQFAGMHDTAICKCEICTWASSTSERRAYAEWSLEAAMNDFLRDYGSDALREKIKDFATTRGLF